MLTSQSQRLGFSLKNVRQNVTLTKKKIGILPCWTRFYFLFFFIWGYSETLNNSDIVGKKGQLITSNMTVFKVYDNMWHLKTWTNMQSWLWPATWNSAFPSLFDVNIHLTRDVIAQNKVAQSNVKGLSV